MATKLLDTSRPKFTLHSRGYALPKRPTVVVCVDGFDPEYLEDGIKSGILPTLQSFTEKGFHVTAKSAMPSFTNPNNVSIITGVPPSTHGISGNFFLDRESGEERMITDDSLLRGSTILAEMDKREVCVAAVTAKDKLRRILSHGLKSGISFSAEAAGSATLDENGIENVEKWIGRPAPSQYSGDLSIYVLDAGLKLLQEEQADLLYLTLSDYIQHKYPPGSRESDQYLREVDVRLGRLVSLGAVVAVTGDHGMSSKATATGDPNVLFLGDELDSKFGDGWGRVICPITDPFVRHHGALGSFVRVYLNRPEQVEDILEYCQSLPLVEVAMTGKDASVIYEMPLDREADIVVISRKNGVIGSKKSEHDLSQVKDHPLRSHGGLSERDVPLIMSCPIRDDVLVQGKNWRNYDIFDLALNMVV
ncbi:hypothetical protein PHISCL_07814 [Aspergillus sclerotialis]|uniref:Phosphonoacetate hydrolase n=1 Tax=Aspergillus sclerotialis TaxID=2070753 RepID=A0A3A2ZB55_9EURO|nr:hypothetical protein PHISCL_07814 [Aspergillus sclerotialis]